VVLQKEKQIKYLTIV